MPSCLLSGAFCPGAGPAKPAFSQGTEQDGGVHFLGHACCHTPSPPTPLPQPGSPLVGMLTKECSFREPVPSCVGN